MKLKIMEMNPGLKPFESDLVARVENYHRTYNELVKEGTLADFANAHHYFGFHRVPGGWVYREWAPAAEKMYLTGDFCNWDRYAYPMEKKENGAFELYLSGDDALRDGQRVMAVVVHNGQELDRIPLYTTRVEQDPQTHFSSMNVISVWHRKRERWVPTRSSGGIFCPV